MWRFRLEVCWKRLVKGQSLFTWSAGSLAGPLLLLLEFIIVERIEGLAVDCRSEGWIRLAPKSLRSVGGHA